MLKTIEDGLLTQVIGGAGAVARSLEALQSKFGGGGWISINGTPHVTPGTSTDVVRGTFKTEPWASGNPSVNRTFTSSVPHPIERTNPATISHVHVLPK